MLESSTFHHSNRTSGMQHSLLPPQKYDQRTSTHKLANPRRLEELDTNKLKHMASQLQNFPDELLVEVLGYLPKFDLRSARLTCTRYASIGAQWLFQRVYFAPRQAAMDDFLDISANPTFARTVTELVYDARLFLPELVAYKPFQEAFDAHIEHKFVEDDEDIAGLYQAGDGTGPINNVDDNYRTLSRSTVSKWKRKSDERYHESLANNLVRYTRLVDQQQSILEDRKDYAALFPGLKSFSNITTLIILDDFDQGREWTPLRIDDHSWYHQRSSHGNALAAPSKWPGDKRPGGAPRKKWDVRGIRTLIRAVSVYCQNLKELHLASEINDSPMTIFELGDHEHDVACTMFRRLTTLKMNVYMSTSDSEEEWQAQNDCLEGFLSEARELRHLAMGGRFDTNVFKDKIWPHLETLNWGDFAINATALKVILQAHKGTLRELTLRNVYMSGDEGWADAAEDVGKYLRLRRVSVLGVCDEVSLEENAMTYLDDEVSLAVAYSFMQSIPRTILLEEDEYTIIACPGVDPSLVEVGDSHST